MISLKEWFSVTGSGFNHKKFLGKVSAGKMCKNLYLMLFKNSNDESYEIFLYLNKISNEKINFVIINIFKNYYK